MKRAAAFLMLFVAGLAAAARQAKGDQLPDASGNCPAPKTKTHGQTTTTTP